MKKIDFSIVLFNDHTNKLQFFTGSDIMMTLFWITISIGVCYYIKSLNKEKEHYKYYMLNFYFKLTFALFFGFFYIFSVKGGDTLAFWDSSVRLTNLFFENPKFYFEEWGQYGESPNYVNHFTVQTGFPPGWILREEEAYFTSKVLSVLNIFTLRSYFANTVILALVSSLVSFKLYDFILTFKTHNYQRLAIYFLFIPSLAFWCSGLSKDTIILICLYFAIPLIYNFFTSKFKIGSLITIFILVQILINIRSFMIITLALPFFFAFNVRVLNLYFNNKYIKRIFNILILVVGLAIISIYFSGESAQRYLNEAKITQEDFLNNSIYTGKKYDLGNVEFTSLGLLKAMPSAIFTGIYRPFPWEATSVSLFLNAIESIILIYLTFVFFFKERKKRIDKIRNSGILTFAIYFVFIIAFMTGLTSIIFGVLVRLRAPLLPFVVMILTVKPDEIKEEEKEVLIEHAT